MEIFLGWLVLASIQLAATMSPGPAFAVTMRHALAHGRRSGVIMAFGLGLGIVFQVCVVLGGLSTILTQSVLLFNIIKYAGAAYLIFIGLKALKAKKRTKSIFSSEESSESEYQPLSDLKSFHVGVWTNVLNPKAVVFFTALFTQFVAPDTPWQLLALYGGTSVFTEIAWFSFVVIVLTNKKVKTGITGIMHWIERVCGGLLIALGVKLAVSKV